MQSVAHIYLGYIFNFGYLMSQFLLGDRDSSKAVNIENEQFLQCRMEE